MATTKLDPQEAIGMLPTTEYIHVFRMSEAIPHTGIYMPRERIIIKIKRHGAEKMQNRIMIVDEISPIFIETEIKEE